jgi:hypothetical protein
MTQDRHSLRVFAGLLPSGAMRGSFGLAVADAAATAGRERESGKRNGWRNW